MKYKQPNAKKIQFGELLHENNAYAYKTDHLE